MSSIVALIRTFYDQLDIYHQRSSGFYRSLGDCLFLFSPRSISVAFSLLFLPVAIHSLLIEPFSLSSIVTIMMMVRTLISLISSLTPLFFKCSSPLLVPLLLLSLYLPLAYQHRLSSSSSCHFLQILADFTLGEVATLGLFLGNALTGLVVCLRCSFFVLIFLLHFFSLLFFLVYCCVVLTLWCL